MGMLRGLVGDLAGLATVVVLLVLVTFLPPDTSLQEVRANNALRVCVPTAYPPLVTGDPERPGIDIEILREVADHLGVRLLLSPIDAMGRDFNPRHWAVTRAKCQLLAGGVVDSALTRSFLDTGPAYARTGWALLAPEPLDGLEGRTLGALTLISGLDRLGLSAYLRRQKVGIRVVPDAATLVEGITGGVLEGGVTELLLARSLAADNGWWTVPMPEELTRHNLVIGLWKGDLTLKRQLVAAFAQMQADGTLDSILARYGVTDAEKGDPGA